MRCSRTHNCKHVGRCGILEIRVEELQRVINRGANQHADGLELMREMQVPDSA